MLLEAKTNKVHNLNEMCYALSIICEKLEKLVIIAEDPRMSTNVTKQRDIKKAV